LKNWPEVEQMQRIPDVFDIPEPIAASPPLGSRRWR